MWRPCSPAQKPRLHPVKQLLAGGVAGIIAKTCVAPLDRARTMIQDAGAGGGRGGGGGGGRRGVAGVCGRVLREEGVGGLFRGNMVSVIKVLPSSALQFAIFENMKEAMGGSLSIPQRLAAGAAAGAVATATCYPLDTLKSQMSVRGGLKGSVVAAAAQLFREQGGLRAFYKVRRCRSTLSNPS